MSELLDNRAHRIRTLKSIIKRLHAGDSPDEVKAELKALIKEVDSTEIAAMEQELMAEGMRVEEVQSMCDLHASVVREVLVEPNEPTLPAGHPAETMRSENEALARTVADMRALSAGLQELPEGTLPAEVAQRRQQLFNDLMDIEKHYQRKEHLIFSCLERHGIAGPSKVMWGKDDEVRKQLKAMGEALSLAESTVAEARITAAAVVEPALKAVEEMIFKEDRILLPMCLDTLTEDEWGEIWQQSPEYGFCLVEPGEAYTPPASVAGPREAALPKGQAVVFPTGGFTYDQLLSMLSALPVDLTFVDADDRVRFFSAGPDRVFARSKAILGRKVQHCHPPKSVDIVDRIVHDFRSGAQDVAEFWIDFQGRFVHIRYFAMRDAAGTYLGTLEVTQDVTEIRGLEGERRLLEY